MTPSPDRTSATSPASGALCFFVKSFPPAVNGGGPIQSIDAVVQEALESDHVAVLTSGYDLGCTTPMNVPLNTWQRYGRARVMYADDSTLRGYIRMLLRLRSIRPETIYVNSIFDLKHSLVPLLLWRFALMRASRFVICPRGELDPGAISISSSKKKRFLAVARILRLHTRVTWHATNPEETRQIKTHCRSDRILELPPKTSLKEQATPRSGTWDARAIIFAARISPKKGLLTLIRAMREVNGPIALTVIGPASDEAYLSECKAEAARLPPGKTVGFAGPKPNFEVRDLFRSFAASALPTLGENFGHSIAESLAAACPPLLPPTTPWTYICQNLGTLVHDSDVGSWTTALNGIVNMSTSDQLRLRLRTYDEYERWSRSQDNPSLPSLIRQVGDESIWG